MAAPNSANPHQHGQGLPSISSLTNGLSQSVPISPDQQSLTDSTRDSGTWPQPQSKHNSINTQGSQLHSLLNPDDSPSHRSLPSTPQSARIPSALQNGGGALPSIGQGLHDAANRDSRELAPPLDSRRSSIDSRMHQGFTGLYINGPHSQHESANASQVSLAHSLRRPPSQTPLSPLSTRSVARNHPQPRVAPPIMPHRQHRGMGGPDPTAAKATPGHPWAFPDSIAGPDPTAPKATPGHPWAFPDSIAEEGDRRGSDSAESSLGEHSISRQNSFATSSIFSNDSQMPTGQRRFDDDATTHHHSMQHRAIHSLQNEGMGGQGIGNYSRTPELRVSHKLAERKRRSEMKDLFEELNRAVPANGGTKASKWEILTKAIDYIKSTQHNERSLHSEVQRLQRDVDYGRDALKENEMLKTECSVMHQHLRRLDPNNTHIYGHFSSQLSAQQNQSQANGGGNIALPPLNSGPGIPASFNGAPSAQMQGVEYGYTGR